MKIMGTDQTMTDTICFAYGAVYDTVWDIDAIGIQEKI